MEAQGPHANGIESSAEVELRGLSIYTHHGVSEAEQEMLETVGELFGVPR